ncbi:unnamed protein product [Prunus armeniaca]
MERFFKRKSKFELVESSPAKSQKKNESSPNQTTKVNSENLPSDPGLRNQILSYHPNVRDQVRRAYLQKGPCQPRGHNFPYKNFGAKQRRFNPGWFSEFPTWLEYSIEKDATFCLCCYLFKPDVGEQSGGESFVGVGFSNWKKKDRLQIHVGGPNSAHNKAWRSCEVLLNQKQHIETILSKHSNQDRIDYRTRLGTSVDVSRILLQQGLPFRGHDESENSTNQGNFLAFLGWLCRFNDDIKAVTLKNAPENMKLTSPDIQKDISSAISTEIINAIIRDIGDSLFAILVDESCDMSSKEHMAIVLHYVDKGWLCRFNDDIKAVTLKNAPENMKLTSPDIQKDISSAISTEIINAIIRDIGDSLFAILVDESCDMSSKEHMAIVLHYVDKGKVIERFVGIVHVTDNKSSSLKLAVDDFFSRHGLSISHKMFIDFSHIGLRIGWILVSSGGGNLVLYALVFHIPQQAPLIFLKSLPFGA